MEQSVFEFAAASWSAVLLLHRLSSLPFSVRATYPFNTLINCLIAGDSTLFFL